MTKGRKTTFEERVEIVQYCIAHDRNYAQTAEQYQVSYQQARNYIVKYEAGGVEALRDNRGKRKRPDAMSELEKLRAEVKILKTEKFLKVSKRIGLLLTRQKRFIQTHRIKAIEESEMIWNDIMVLM